MSRELLQRVLKVLKVKRLRLNEHLIPIIMEEIEAELAKPDEKPEWQELYKDEVFAILAGDDEWSSLEFAQSISDLLREKNT